MLITGMSGGGKTQALRYFEDRDYFCVDNLPASLLTTFAELALRSQPPRERVAVCIDARTGFELIDLPKHMADTASLGYRTETIFLDASDEALRLRYSETRRRHPASPHGSVDQGIRLERELLGPIRTTAEHIIDTSALSVSALRERIGEMYHPDQQELSISLVSFGFKFGLPQEADLVFDVRFLPNPHYDDRLRPLRGTDSQVRDYVLSSDDAKAFLERVRNLLRFLLPRFEDEGKSYLTIAFGCTGGLHRSVVLAESEAGFLQELGYERVRVRHRDIGRTGRDSE